MVHHRPALAAAACLTMARLTVVQAIEPPTTVGEIFDGTCRDIAANRDRIWLAQGRNLVILDPATGRRVADDDLSPFPEALVAVEYEGKTDALVVATEHTVYVRSGDRPVKTWTEADLPTIADVKTWPGTNKLFVIGGNALAVVDYAGMEMRQLSQITLPPGLSHVHRLHVMDVDGRMMAYVTAQLADARRRGVRGLAIADLDSADGYTDPSFYEEYWDPVQHYGNPMASAHCVQVIPNLTGDDDYAYVACGVEGQLTKLNVTDPSNPQPVGKIDLAVDSTGDGKPDFDVFQVLKDPEHSRLYVASANLLHIVDPAADQELGSRNVGFYDAGDRDMAYRIGPNGERQIWTATHHSVSHVLKCIDVTRDTPNLLLNLWWISSCDGAVAVPGWGSVYLPTFGGVARYDVSDETNPVPVADGYQPANGTTEHIELMWLDADERDQALLLTAPGNGGVRYFPVSVAEKNPGPPTHLVEKPVAWGTDPVYQNDVACYRRDGANYVLADLANRRTHEVALQAYNMVEGTWLNAVEQRPELGANSKDIEVFGDFAAVTCRGGFFVVRLDALPEAMSVVQEVVVLLEGETQPKTISGIAANADLTHLFLGTDGPGQKAVLSYAFDADTGKARGPVDVLTGPEIPGSTSRARYHAAAERLYVPSRGGNLLEVDVSDPTDLRLLSIWQSPRGYSGEMQDAYAYDFGNGPRILAVKNNEGFAILDPDDGL